MMVVMFVPAPMPFLGVNFARFNQHAHAAAQGEPQDDSP
jgi:hypothetical protein